MEDFKSIFESAVGLVGRTGYADAKAHVGSELRTEFKKIVRAIGGKTVARQLLAEMNNGGPLEESDADIKKAIKAGWEEVDDWIKAEKKTGNTYKTTSGQNSITLHYSDIGDNEWTKLDRWLEGVEVGDYLLDWDIKIHENKDDDGGHITVIIHGAS